MPPAKCARLEFQPIPVIRAVEECAVQKTKRAPALHVLCRRVFLPLPAIPSREALRTASMESLSASLAPAGRPVIFRMPAPEETLRPLASSRSEESRQYVRLLSRAILDEAPRNR